MNSRIAYHPGPPCPSAAGRPRVARTAALVGGALLALLAAPSLARAAHVSHHELAARLDPERAYLTANDEAHILLASPEERSQPLHLLLNRDLEMTGINFPGGRGSWQAFPVADPEFFPDFADSAGLVFLDRCQEIVLTPTEQAGWPDDSFQVTFDYRGVVYDSLRAPEVSYARSFPTSDGLIDSAGAYLAGSSAWVPAMYGDLFTFRLTADLPDPWRSMSQGRLVSSATQDGRRTEVWIDEHPMESIYLIAGAYQVDSTRAGSVDVFTYLYQPEPELRARYQDATSRYLERYSNLIGPYPFSKFALVENFWQTGYGMPSFTLLGDRVIRLPFIIDTSYGHEILHNWWGNGVFVDEKEGNWCEGLTAYGADYAYKEDAGAAEAREYRRGILRDYRNYVRTGTDFPLAKFTERSNPVTATVGYGKTSMVFHMLRTRVGDERFREALRLFYRENLFRKASWSDVIDAFEAVSGEELDWYLEQWVHQPGAPNLQLEEAEVSEEGDPHRLSFVITQDRPVYRLRVPIVVHGEDRDTTFTVDVMKERKRVEVKLPWPPREMAVDPDFQCFRHVDRSEIPVTISQTLGADSAIVVLPEAASDSLRDAYAALAESWGGGDQHLRIMSESELTEADLRDRAVWLFGPSRFASLMLESLGDRTRVGEATWVIGGVSYPAPGHSLVLTAASPGDPELSWTWFLCDDPEAVNVVGRKLTHYGKYTYLVFEGGSNVGKGVLEPPGSPLEARF